MYRLDWMEYHVKLSAEFPTLDEALTEVRHLVSPSTLGCHSKGIPVLLSAPNGRTVDEDTLWAYGGAVVDGDDPQPTLNYIVALLADR